MRVEELFLSAVVGAVVAVVVTWYFGLYYTARSHVRATKFEFQVKQCLTAILKGLERSGSIQLSKEMKDFLPLMIRVGDEEFFPSNVSIANRAWWNKGPIAWWWDRHIERLRKKRASETTEKAADRSVDEKLRELGRKRQP